MEEDIKILEEQLKAYKRHLENYEKGECLTNVYYELKKYATALENLIKGYRELELQNKLYQKVHVIVENIDTEKLLLKITEDESVPKSKIKENIEELDSKAKYCAISDLTEYMYKKEVLLELLEDK